MSLPVLLIAYNRPDATRKCLNHIRQYGPSRLYVACDGARESSRDQESVENVRSVLRSPGWQTKRFELFTDQNLGPGRTVESAINWFFQNEAMGIILEDDCLANLDFFRLSEHFLLRFKENPQVWGFTGSNTVRLKFQDSYGFIRQPLTWGWASWADRWKQHADRPRGEEFLNSKPTSAQWPSKAHQIAYSRHLESIAKYGVPDAWDYQWAWTVMKNQGVWGVSRDHLVMNIGFGKNATNTHPRTFSRCYTTSPLNLKEPKSVLADEKSDRVVLKKIHNLLFPLWLNYPANLFRRLSAAIAIFPKRLARNWRQAHGD